MSAVTVAWALAKKVPANQKLVLLVMALYAGQDRNHHFYNGHARSIADQTRLSIESVRRALARLEERGLIFFDENGDFGPICHLDVDGGFGK